jgi:hypothetical protein
MEGSCAQEAYPSYNGHGTEAIKSRRGGEESGETTTPRRLFGFSCRRAEAKNSNNNTEGARGDKSQAIPPARREAVMF